MTLENCWSCQYAKPLEGGKMFCNLHCQVRKTDYSCQDWEDMDGD